MPLALKNAFEPSADFLRSAGKNQGNVEEQWG
jgi:hypothetical protein